MNFKKGDKVKLSDWGKQKLCHLVAAYPALKNPGTVLADSDWMIAVKFTEDQAGMRSILSSYLEAV